MYKVTAGINGAGRFGLHLLQYWIEHHDSASFDVQYINDDYLSWDAFKGVIKNDKYLRLNTYVTFALENFLTVKLPNNEVVTIAYTHTNYESIPWRGNPVLFMECSGKHTRRSNWQDVLIKSTKHVIISATSWTADQMLVYGFNHTSFRDNEQKILSYGSCTVNAYVPLAQAIHDEYRVMDSDVNIIHNIPVHQASSFNTLERRDCTLEIVAPQLLDFLRSNNFVVSYTLVPYTGVSIIDYRFRIKSGASEVDVRDRLEQLITRGRLKGLYGLSLADNGPDEHKFSPYSAVLLIPSIKLVTDNLYISAYFDNENSTNRYFDLANFLSRSLKESNE